MQVPIPEFESPFLNHLSQQLKKRRKALSFFGEITFATMQPDEFDWLTINFRKFGGHFIIFQFVEDNRISIFVRSSRRADRGKVLFRRENFHVVDNSESIVDAVEATVRSAHDLNGQFEHTNNPEKIFGIWKSVAVDLTDDPVV